MNNFKKGLFEVLRILEVYLDEIVIGGGWAPQIYYHYLIKDSSVNHVFTRDIDFIVENKVKGKASKSIRRILEDAGLEEKIKGRTSPPPVLFEGSLGGYEVEIEFLTNLKGNKKISAIDVQDGLYAEALKYMSISVENTIELNIHDFPYSSGKSGLIIKVPSPGAFIFHKGIIFTKRVDKLKREKDLFYIFEILVNCDVIRKEIVSQFMELRKKYTSWFTKYFRKNMNKYFVENKTGCDYIINQRPSNFMINYNDDQFRNFVEAKIEDFLKEIVPELYNE